MQLARVRRLLASKPKHRCRLEGNTAVATLPFPARLFPTLKAPEPKLRLFAQATTILHRLTIIWRGFRHSSRPSDEGTAAGLCRRKLEGSRRGN
jgi:hypothetical protein